MIQQRVMSTQLSSGIAEHQLIAIQSVTLDPSANQVVRHQEDVSALRTISGIESAAAVDTLPLDENDNAQGTCASEQALLRAAQAQAIVGNCAQVSVYDGSPGMVKTLGLHLLAGRDFHLDEFVSGSQLDPPVAIITRALAKKLYPNGDALGETLYTDPDKPIRIVGIVDNVLRPSLHGSHGNYDSMFWPQYPDQSVVTYVISVATQNRAWVLKRVSTALYQLDANRILGRPRAFAQVRASYFQNDESMIGLLVCSALGLLLVSALGITGLSNFWVQQRMRTVGIRRALGATRMDILRYFQIENFIIVSFGVVFGILMGIGLNLLLMVHFEVSKLPLWYLALGAVALWILGQLAALAPALRASKLSPVAATRNI